MADTPPILNGEAKTKTFSLNKDDLDFLVPRQTMINQYKLALGDIDFVMQQFLVRAVLPRLSIDPQQYSITFNVEAAKITCTPKPPEIIVPNGVVAEAKKD